MKKTFISVIVLCLLGGMVFATSEDNQLIDALEDLESTKVEQELMKFQEDLSFDTFESCEDMTTVLEDFIKDNFENVAYGRGWAWREPMMMEDTMDFAESDGVMLKSAVAPVGEAINDVESFAQDIGSSTTDFSTTNLQVDGVDEADILKTDGDYIYYYNQRNQEIDIMKSPLDISSATINLDDAEVIKIINLPETFNGTEMYIQDNKLILLAQRWREGREETFVQRNDRTNVVIYDVSDVTKPSLLKLSDLDGSYHDSRMVGNTLYVVSQLHVNRRWGRQYFEEEDAPALDVTDILPKTIDISYTTDVDKRNLTIANTTYPYRVSVERPSCKNVKYILPSKESIDEFELYPSFTVVRAINIDDTDETPTTSTSFGTTQTIHMSEDSLYLTNPIYVSRSFSCLSNVRCVLPWYQGGQHTLIHKFDIHGQKVNYIASNLVQGTPLTQYSMSEDNHGNFRILTKSWNQQVTTHLFVLDDDLDLQGMLMNIEPGEEFKSSRYIGDKLYLVTFERTDPLFVIDLADTSKPKIVGELKIPGFSTYLHPYAPAAHGKQYLIGLGYATTENERGRVVTDGIKLDLYEIDYTKKIGVNGDCENYHYSTCPEYCIQRCRPSSCSAPDENGDITCTDDCDGAGSCANKDMGDNDYVQIKQLYTQTWGEKNSYSEALENPRMFVWDEERKLVVLPMILSNTEKAQNCNIQYNSNGEEISRDCRDNEKYDTTFAGLKAINIDIVDGIDEAFSYNFLDKLKDDKQVYRNNWDGTIYPWQFSQLNFRVGYLGDVLYTVNNLFAHFAVMGRGQGTYVEFEE